MSTKALLFSGSDPTLREEILPPRGTTQLEEKAKTVRPGEVRFWTPTKVVFAAVGFSIVTWVSTFQDSAEVRSGAKLPVRDVAIDEDSEAHEAWTQAVQLLTEQGVDVEALLAKAGTVVSAWSEQPAKEPEGDDVEDEV